MKGIHCILTAETIDLLPKEIDKLYADRTQDQADKSGLNTIFQKSLAQAKTDIPGSTTRPDELSFNVGNGIAIAHVFLNKTTFFAFVYIATTLVAWG